MSFVFVSHAAPDKRDRVRPLAMALAIEGVPLWLDRPGPGPDDFQLPEDFIRRHGIRSIPLGDGWDAGVRQALREAGAVLVCLSKTALDPQREVLRQEMFGAQLAMKAVSCIVDDLDPQQIPDQSGLLLLGRAQALRVDPAALARAVAWLQGAPGRTPDALDAPLAAAWQAVRRLRAELERAARGASTPVPAPEGSARVATLHALLALHPVASAMLHRLYWRSLPRLGRQPPAVSLPGLLADLDNLPPRKALLPSPLVEFAERLARETGEPAFGAWVDEQTAAEPSARLALRQLLQEEARRAPPPATLYVDVDPQMAVITWWVHAADRRLDGDRRQRSFGGTPADALAACLPAALQDAAEWLRRTDTAAPAAGALPAHRLRVALLLPRDLLTRELDSLPVTIDEGAEIGETTEPLYRRHPVTLHWRTRASPVLQALGRNAVDRWSLTVESLKPRLAGGGGAGVVWATDDDRVDDAAQRLLDAASEEICVGLGPRRDTLEADVKACVLQGLPCFFWFRRAPADPAALQPTVCGAFSQHTPAEAPLRIGEHRMRDRADGPFGALSVVWDEPGHLPPEDLNAPPPEGTPP